MSNYDLLINGKLVAGDQSMDIINPATEEVAGTCGRASEAQLNEAVAAAKAAQPAWAALPLEARQDALKKVVDIVNANAAEIGQVLTSEQGKPLEEAVAEAYGFAYYTQYFASLDLPVDVIEDSDTRRVEAHYVPLGVVAGIVPWNFPLVLMSFKMAPALLAGNTLIIKPAPTTPLSTLLIASLIKDVLPPGVFNVITDDNDLGPVLSAHPDVRKISFTGSTATGSKVMASAAQTLKRVTLELGGNDPAVVLADVDPKAVAPMLFGAAFYNNGQICIAMKRLYVHEAIYDAVCDEIATIAKARKVGNGADEGVEHGPLQNRAQFEKVRALIEDAKTKGTIIAGGGIPEGPGYFIEPTVVRDIQEGARLVDEEQFGPALPIIKFSDVDEVIDRINQSAEGLGASVWSNDIEQATAVAKRLEAGTVWVNKHSELDPSIPFSGAKQSGLGTELGLDGVLEFTQRKIVNIAK